jgi:hypothetical protein
MCHTCNASGPELLPPVLMAEAGNIVCTNDPYRGRRYGVQPAHACATSLSSVKAVKLSPSV